MCLTYCVVSMLKGALFEGWLLQPSVFVQDVLHIFYCSRIYH